MKYFLMTGLLVCVLASTLYAGEGHAPIAVPPSAEFESVKKLVGTWEGTATEKDGKVSPARAEYKLTSGGSAVVEILFAGTPHEMHSIYFNENGKLGMTHYCMLGNRPKLALQKSAPGEIFLDLSPGSGIDTAKEPHMHSLKLTFPDDNTLRQEWSYYENGQVAGLTTIELKRAV